MKKMIVALLLVLAIGSYAESVINAYVTCEKNVENIKAYGKKMFWSQAETDQMVNLIKNKYPNGCVYTTVFINDLTALEPENMFIVFEQEGEEISRYQIASDDVGNLDVSLNNGWSRTVVFPLPVNDKMTIHVVNRHTSEVDHFFYHGDNTSPLLIHNYGK